MSISELEEHAAPAYGSRRERRAAERASEAGALATQSVAAPGGDSEVGSVFARPRRDGLAMAGALEFEPLPLFPPASGLTSPPLSGSRPAPRPAPVKPRRRGARLARAVFSTGAALAAAALAVVTLIPPSLFGTVDTAAATQAGSVMSSDGAASARQDLSLSGQLSASESGLVLRSDYSSQSRASVAASQVQASGQVLVPSYIPAATTVQWPFDHSVPVSSGFGWRTDPIEFHTGFDLDPGYGTPIGAIADGVVTWVGWDYTGYGYYVIVAHVIGGQRIDSLYGHMISGSSTVYPGMTVHAGEVLGLTGDTGYSTGPHLHLELRLDGKAFDPYPWMLAHVAAGSFVQQD